MRNAARSSASTAPATPGAILASGRPTPPDYLVGFAPDHGFAQWIKATMLAETGTLHNPDHSHLAEATLGVLWTNVENVKRGRSVIGQAWLMPPGGTDAWGRARAEQQLEEWFGDLPDFVLMFYAPFMSMADDASFCAVVEHELYHCAQELDEYGAPRFNKQTGEAMFTMRAHDVEEFVGVVRRYGAEATPAALALVQAAQNRPEIAAASIAAACGTCLLRRVA